MKELGLAGTKLPVGTSSWKCKVGGYWKIPAEVWCLFQAQSLISCLSVISGHAHQGVMCGQYVSNSSE